MGLLFQFKFYLIKDEERKSVIMMNYTFTSSIFIVQLKASYHSIAGARNKGGKKKVLQRESSSSCMGSNQVTGKIKWIRYCEKDGRNMNRFRRCLYKHGLCRLQCIAASDEIW